MNIDSKIWALTSTGTKRHAFNGESALCRKSLKTPVRLAERGTGLNYFEAKGVSMCTRCAKAFEAALEEAETTPADTVRQEVPATPVQAASEAPAVPHPAAGVYSPTAGGRMMTTGFSVVSATVDEDGAYTVFAGTRVIRKGVLDGSEGPLMAFFAGIVRQRNDLLVQKTVRITADPVEADSVVASVLAHGGHFRSRVQGFEPALVEARTVAAVLRDVRLYRGTIRVASASHGLDDWSVEVCDLTGQVIAEYHCVPRERVV